MRNIPQSIEWRMGRNLHKTPGHPITTVKELIERALPSFKVFDNFPPVVSIAENFDFLEIPQNHPSRSHTDTYYWDNFNVLRTHTSAHQVPLLRKGEKKFLVAGDVYRKDAIDRTHFPVFHQMEGVSLIEAGAKEQDPKVDLENNINRLLRAIFPGCVPTWKPDSFPFTNPSFAVSVEFEGKELEVLGCGVIAKKVLQNGDVPFHKGWAFGIGLERLAMKLFSIPDIRLFWSTDPRAAQWKPGEIAPFRPFSEHPSCTKDMSFWLPKEGFEPNAFFDIVRNIAGELVEEVKEIDSFEKDGRTSKCFRVSYRSMERVLTNEEVDEVQEKVRQATRRCLFVELR